MFLVQGSRFKVHARGLVLLLLALACLMPLTAVHAGDPACLGVDDPLPLAIDPMTPEAELPCFAGFPAPAGHPGAVPFYDADGQLGWVDSDGAVLSGFGVSMDNARVATWAAMTGRSLGEKVLILQQNQQRKGRALSIVEVING